MLCIRYGLLMCNCTSAADALKPSELVDRLDLGRLLTGHKWHVQATCASTGDGIYEAMESLSHLVKDIHAQRRYY